MSTNSHLIFKTRYKPIITWAIFLSYLILSNSVFAKELAYRAIHQVNPSSEGFDKEFEEIKPLYAARLKEENMRTGISSSNIDRSDFGIDTFDLNDDGTKEIFVWVENRIECGANSCPVDIYELDSSRRLRVLYSGSAHGVPKILASMSNGYHDLAFYGWGQGKEFYLIWRFDGAQYKFFNQIPADQLVAR